MARAIPPAAREAPAAPTDVLAAEHRNIERVLACLERMADAFEEADRVERAPAEEALEFLRTYADRLHHGKEEALLFPAMEARGIPADAGPTAVMRAEHDEGRALVRAMAGAAAGGSTGEFVRAAREFADLLRRHIAKEDQVLFPMAEEILPPQERERLRAAFGEVEARDVGPDVVGRMVALCGRLCARYGVTEVPRPRAGTCDACCGR